jgi:hypothetical protein
MRVLCVASAGMVVRLPDPNVLALVAAGVALAPFGIISYLVIVATMTTDERRRATAERMLDRLLLAGLLRRRPGRRNLDQSKPPEGHARGQPSEGGTLPEMPSATAE